MKDYLNAINENNTQFYLLMDRYVKLYPKYKMNTDEYEDSWSRLNNQLNKLDNDTFLLQNSIENDNVKINSKIKAINLMIADLEAKNKILKQKLKYLQTNDNAAEGLIDDTTKIYNENLYYLFLLIISTCSISYALIKQISV